MTKTTGIWLFFTTILILAAVPVFAQTNAPAPATPVVKHKGAVTAIDTTGSTITITYKKQAPETFAVTSATKIRVDKAPGTLADIKVGMRASISSADGKTADRIHATDKAAAGANGGGKGASIAGIPAQIP